jgi:hypothetical protein
MGDRARTKAPRWRVLAAGLADAGLIGGGWALARRRGVVEGSSAAGRLLAVSGEAMREQLRSPGQRLLGVRTVDARTGHRVAAWRTLVLLGAAFAGQAAGERLKPADDAPAKHAWEDFNREVREAAVRHRDDPEARAAELRRLSREHKPPPVRLWAFIAPTIAVGLLNRVLRRRIAPTVEVLDGSHSP